MQIKEFKDLLDRYQAGTCSVEERRQVEAWIRELEDLPVEIEEGALESDLKAIWRQLHEETQPALIYWSPKRILSRVAVLLLLGLASYWGYQKYKASAVEHVRLEESLTDIPPGADKAMLTLGDGQVIALEDLQVGADMEQSGVVLKKLNNGELVYKADQDEVGSLPVTYNTIRTPKGGQFKVVLPDGSQVWLNASSSLRYPTQFTTAERIVELEGEGYFEVEPNMYEGKKQAFIVRSDSQEVEVLGTHFNINDYQDESHSATTLLEGSVRVTRLNQGEKTDQSSMLKPGEQSLLTADNFEVYPTQIQHAVAWKNGYFHFERVDLKTMMRQFERWYDVEVEYQTDRYGDEFVGDVPRSVTLSKALRILELGGVHFKQEGRKVIITE